MILKSGNLSHVIFAGVPLPGIFRSLSVNGDLELDSGISPYTPKSVLRGFKNKTIQIGLALVPEEGLETGLSAYAQLGILEGLFQAGGGGKKLLIANPHILARGIVQAVFKSLTSSEQGNELLVSIVFEEFCPPVFEPEG